MLVTVLNKYIGYDKAALEPGYPSEKEFEDRVKPEEKVHPD